MRFAIVSDLHANLQAWNAVYADITARGVDRILCLGDVVGYGPQPAETLASAYESVDLFVLGNHDAVVAGLLDPAGFNPDAQRMIEWTCGQLHGRAMRFFEQVPLMLRARGFRCVHGAPVKPRKFYYVTNEKVARACWRHAHEPILFVGHTHKPCVHRLEPNGTYARCRAGDFTLRENHRYVVNVGSVGMPRDKDFRASYCLYDPDARTVRFCRVPFDLEAFRAEVKTRIGHSRQSAEVLSFFDRQKGKPLRQAVDFSPKASKASRAMVEERDVSELRTKMRLWKKIAVGALVGLLIVAVIGGLVYLRLPKRETVRSRRSAELSIARTPKDKPFDLLPGTGPARARPPAGWQFAYEYAQQQEASVRSDGLHLTSWSERHALEVQLPPIRLGPCRKYQIRIQGRKLTPCRGELPLIAIDYILPGGQQDLRAETKNIIEREDELSTQYTFRVRQDVKAIRPRLVGAFVGEILFDRFVLVPREAE